MANPLNKLSQSVVPSLASSPHLTPDLHNLALPIRGDRGKQGRQERQESRRVKGDGADQADGDAIKHIVIVNVVFYTNNPAEQVIIKSISQIVFWD